MDALESEVNTRSRAWWSDESLSHKPRREVGLLALNALERTDSRGLMANSY